MENPLVRSLFAATLVLTGIACSSGSSGGGGGGLTVTSFTPTSGDAGDTITIDGTGFSAFIAEMEVSFFDDVAAVVTSATTTQLEVTVPAGAATGPITVTNLATSESDTTSSDFTLNPLAPPVLDEVEPNDAFDEATVVALTLGRAGRGSLATEADVDFWSMDLTAGNVVSIELFGTRFDHASWEAGDTIPRITVYNSDGTTVVLNHDLASQWGWGKHDLDHPLLYVPVAGTYFASVTVDGLDVTDGDYCIRATLVNLGALQIETGDDVGDNDTAANAEPIVPGTIGGFHDDNNPDFFSFAIAGPSIVRFELTAHRNGLFLADDEYFDPLLLLYDVDGATALEVNDDSFFFDSAIHYSIDTPGTYFLEVTECCGAGDAPYFLTYSRADAGGGTESEPNEDAASADSIAYGGSIRGSIDVGEIDWLRFDGTMGDMVRIQVFDAGNSLGKTALIIGTVYGPDGVTPLPFGPSPVLGNLQTVTTILQETGPHYITVEPDTGTTDYRIELTRFRSATYESEPNDDFSQPNPLGAGGRSAGVIGTAADADTFEFTALPDRLTTISIYASHDAVASDGFFEFSGHGSLLAPTLRILDAGGNPIATSPADWLAVSTESVTNGLPCAAVSFAHSAGGTYFVEVTDALGGSGADFYYVIERTN